jgi:hypothetical protein
MMVMAVEFDCKVMLSPATSWRDAPAAATSIERVIDCMLCEPRSETLCPGASTN